MNQWEKKTETIIKSYIGTVIGIHSFVRLTEIFCGVADLYTSEVQLCKKYETATKEVFP